MPSGEVAAVADAAAIATKTPLPKVTDTQLPAGMLRVVHVIPSVDDAAYVLPAATKIPLP